jgi:hypothetical protein
VIVFLGWRSTPVWVAGTKYCEQSVVFLGWRSTTVWAVATKYYSQSECVPRLAFHGYTVGCN